MVVIMGLYDYKASAMDHLSTSRNGTAYSVYDDETLIHTSANLAELASSLLKHNQEARPDCPEIGVIDRDVSSSRIGTLGAPFVTLHRNLSVDEMQELHQEIHSILTGR